MTAPTVAARQEDQVGQVTSTTGYADSGMVLVSPPGLTDARDWHPGQPPSSAGKPDASRILAGVARKE